MEVIASADTPLQPGPSYGNHPFPSAMDASMDIDMDLDLGPMPENEQNQTEPMTVTSTAAEGALDPQSEEALYEKVHVRGVDELTTDNIKEFATSHFAGEKPSRVEWIDDTSANLVYSSADVGLQALSALTQITEEEDASSLPALRLRTAKLLASHPDSVLQVRSAVKTDRKKARAHESSRFYLMHPEHDPREKLRRELSDRRRQGGDSIDGDYRRRLFDDRELRRRRDRDADGQFGASMYDDGGATSSDHSDRRPRRGRQELFPEDEGRSSGRLRNRSASPGRDTLVEHGYSDPDERASRRRFRERSPGRRNLGKELFPSSGTGDSEAPRELFPNKPTSSYLKKELFPNKVSNHRRSDAIDAADETAHLFARKISLPLVDGQQEEAPSQRKRNIELFPDSSAPSGASIRGSSGRDQGFSIRGSANEGISIKGRGASVRELFPNKYNSSSRAGSNADKELFSDKIEGRGGPRRKAEDLFG